MGILQSGGNQGEVVTTICVDWMGGVGGWMGSDSELRNPNFLEQWVRQIEKRPRNVKVCLFVIVSTVLTMDHVH